MTSAVARNESTGPAFGRPDDRLRKSGEKVPDRAERNPGCKALFLILREQLLAHGVKARFLIVAERIVEIGQRRLHGLDRLQHGF